DGARLGSRISGTELPGIVEFMVQRGIVRDQRTPPPTKRTLLGRPSRLTKHSERRAAHQTTAPHECPSPYPSPDTRAREFRKEPGFFAATAQNDGMDPRPLIYGLAMGQE